MKGAGSYDCVADVPTAATPLVRMLSANTGIPMITPRELKTHGSGAMIDGVYKPGQNVALFDDLITKATSKIEAAKVLEAEGLVVKDIFVLVDREQGGQAQLEAAGYVLHTAWRMCELIRFYREVKFVSEEAYDEITAYLAVN